jgi:hypothetical protein
MAHQQVMVKLTPAQALRMERMGECLWPTEELSVEEIGRRMRLEYLLWREDELCLVDRVRQ